MFKPRYFISLTLAFLTRFKGVIFLGVLLGVFVFFVIRFVIPLLGIGKTEYIGVTGRFSSDKLPNYVFEQIGQGLTKIKDNGTFEPALATSWEIEDDGKTWVFKLKETYWQDGKRVYSDSINYSFEDVRVERPDKDTIVFKLDSVFAPFPSAVAKPVFRKGLLGTGKSEVKNLSLVGNFVERISIKDVNDYTKIYKFYPTEERTKLAFKLGEVDKLVDLIDPKPFDHWPTAKVEKKVNKQRLVVIFYNVEDKILSEKLIRQALSYAIEKEELIAKHEGFSRAIGPISENSWAFNPQIKQYNYDRERALELLKDAEEKLGQKVDTLNLVTTASLLDLADEVANYWNQLGIKTTVQVTSVLPSEFQAFLVMYDIPLDPDQYSTWHSKQIGTNISRYKDPRIDKLLEDGRQELDLDKRKKNYLDFQRFLLEDVPATFLFYPVSYTVSRK